MKKVTLLAIASVTLFACGGEGENTSNVTLTNNMDSVSYAIGTSQAKGLMAQVPELNVAAFMKGYKDVSDSNDLVISDADAQVMLQAFGQKKQMEAAAKQQEEQEAMYSVVKEEGLKFLEENKTKEGVQVTASGLQYIVLKEGTGTQATSSSDVIAHYHGTTPNGEVFDSSVDRGEPIPFNLGQVIPGWTEGVALMKEGAKYKFFIPQELAYGANAPQG
ncbi:MAG: FKBP-type peptidyl-prolyl cis-trans isomerase, partial [Flavobacteriales bacterium]|nr:FKBP-type peptidyl-prolyl cis-trans isomerase [Flavobacteriales bacterium]